MPFLRYSIAILVFLTVATVSILGLRGRRSDQPPLEIFPDMDRQDYYRPQDVSPFFPDQRADRPVVPGTVPAGAFHEDDHFAAGKRGGEFERGFPISVTRELMELGQEKYTIFCSVCHGANGDGNGITKSYGMVATPLFHVDTIRAMPEGEIFNTITYGKNNMGPYGARLRIQERWAIIAYLRALQRANNAREADVPAEYRVELGL